MALTVLTDHARIRAELDRFVATDPVRHTIMGTIGMTLTGSAWAARSADGLAVRSSDNFPLVVAGRWPDVARDELAGLLRELPNLRGLSGPEDLVEPLIARVRDDREVRRIGQRLFRLDELIVPLGVPGDVRIGGEPEREVVREWFAAFLREVRDDVADSAVFADRALDGGGVFVWTDGGVAVSMAARRPVIGGSARVGPVYTPPDARGHGYASAVTAAATRSILDEGAVPVLFTDLANPTSNKIYQLLGYYPLEDRVVVDFA